LSLLTNQDELLLKQLDFIQLTLPRRPGFIVSQGLAAYSNMDTTTIVHPSVAIRKLCEDRVPQDNEDFGITSFYLPNPFFTDAPKWCLVAMEPSLGGMTPEEFQLQLDRGFLNFLWSEGDFILHYCAFTFLCGQSFDYHITDISKGAMKTAVANSRRSERYGNWLALLKNELRLLNNPRLIAIGSSAGDYLRRKNFVVDASIMHYSQQNSFRFRDYYLQHPNNFLADDVHTRLRKFSAGLLNTLNYHSSLRDFILSRLFNAELSVWKKGLFLSYMDAFSATRS
jgi:hypothetical protein